MVSTLKNKIGQLLKLEVETSFGKATKRRDEDEIEIYVPTVSKLAEFLIVLLFIPICIVILQQLFSLFLSDSTSVIPNTSVEMPINTSTIEPDTSTYDPNVITFDSDRMVSVLNTPTNSQEKKTSGFAGMIANIILLGLAGFIFAMAAYANTLFNKIPSKIKINKFQKYIYLDSPLSNLVTVPINSVKAIHENSRVIIEFEKGVEVWLDLNSVEDKGFQAELLKYLGLSETSNK